jgi:hypothetical protein
MLSEAQPTQYVYGSSNDSLHWKPPGRNFVRVYPITLNYITFKSDFNSY